MGSGNSSSKITFAESNTPEAILHAKSFNDLYNLGEEIGGGSFAVVSKCIRKSNSLSFAAKIINKRYLSTKEIIGLKNEIAILRKLSHKNVIKLIDVFDDGKAVTIILELCDGKDLFDEIACAHKTRFTEQKAAKITYDLSKVLNHLHSNGIIHRDLKPENILFGMDGTLKLSDFGLAYSSKISCKKSKNSFERILMKTCCGTPHYVAPEIVKRQYYNHKCDFWSLGVILWIMLVGYQPFRASSLNGIYKLIAMGRYTFNSKRWDTVSIQAKHLVKHLLEMNPKIRYSHKDIESHIWIMKYVNINSLNISVLDENEHKVKCDSPKSPISPMN
eukprot:978641_1